MKAKWIGQCCPLCGLPYSKKRHRTYHHVFPKCWYGYDGITVEVCDICHQEFNKEYPMDIEHCWSREQCRKYWTMFCASKYKIAVILYPQLKKHI